MRPFLISILCMVMLTAASAVEYEDVKVLKSIPEEYRGIFVVTSIYTNDYNFVIPVNNYEFARLTALKAQSNGSIEADQIFSYKIKKTDKEDEDEYFKYVHITWKNSDIYWRFYYIGDKLYLTTYRKGKKEGDSATILNSYCGRFDK